MSQSRLSVSTWSLHRALGPTYWDSPANPSRDAKQPYGPGSVSLLDIPARVADMGIHRLEICHFHLPSRDDSYLHDLHGVLDDAGIELFSLLIDDGDISDPDHREREIAWIAGWLETAGKLGAKHARVIGGNTVGEGAVECSQAALLELAEIGVQNGVRLMTENFRALLATPENVLALLEPLDGRVGLCADFGNFKGASKYDDLAQIFPLADSCHAKCAFSMPMEPDTADYTRCLDLTREAGFVGPYTLIYDGPNDDEWAGIALERDMVLASGAIS